MNISNKSLQRSKLVSVCSIVVWEDNISTVYFFNCLLQLLHFKHGAI